MHHSGYFRRAGDTWSPLAAAILLLWPMEAFGNTVRLDCSLRDIETYKGAQFDRLVGTESRSIIVVLDEERMALTMYQDGSMHVLRDVTITQTSIDGALDQISLGIDRASGSIVFQTYGPESIRAEFGACTPSAEPLP